jgi:hypothetical protein
MASDREQTGRPAKSSDGSEPDSRPSIGAYLRRQRELREITIGELADLTRIPLRSLERLESGAFDRHVDGFVRGFVRTVALALGLDAGDTLSRLLEEPALDDRPHGKGRMVWHPVLLASLAVAVIAAVVALLAVSIQLLGVSPSNSDQGEVVHRRDPVRALAESEAARAESGLREATRAAPAAPAAALPGVSSMGPAADEPTRAR